MEKAAAVTVCLLCLLLLLVFSTQASSPPTLLVPQTKASGGVWTTKASMPTPESGLGAAVVNGKIYVMLGSRVNYEYNPATNTWTTKKPMPTGRSLFATAVYQNKIYVIGGTDAYSVTGVNEVYDPITDTWENKTSMPTPRFYSSANVVNGKIYLMGGIISLTTGEVSSLNEVYDPATDTWTTKAAIPTAGYEYPSAVVDNKIYLISSPLRIYDPATDTWSTGTSPPQLYSDAAAGATTGVWAPKRIYVLGVLGWNQDANKTNQVYNPEDDSWTVGATMPTTRFRFAVAVVKDRLYAIGGFKRYFDMSPENALASNEQYTPIGYGTVPPPDTTPPTISIISPENKTYTVNHVSLTFIVSEPASWMGYSIDRQTTNTIAGNKTLTGLSDGTHNLTVYANNLFGNTGASETIYFSIKTQQPEPFPITWIAAAIVIIAVVGAALLVYFAKVKKTGKAEK